MGSLGGPRRSGDLRRIRRRRQRRPARRERRPGSLQRLSAFREGRPGFPRSRSGSHDSGSVRHRLRSFVVLVLVLGLSAGCNFERRPQTQVNADPGQIVTPVPEESAATFLEDLQSARSGSDVEAADLRPFLHRDAAVIREGHRLPLNEGDSGSVEDAAGDGAQGGEAPGTPSGWDVLTTLPGRGAVPSEIADSGVFDGSAFYVVRYGPAVETLYLARDSVGWSLRLLQRVDEGG